MSVTVPEFLSVVRKSGVVEPAVLAAWLEKQTSRPAAEPAEFAARLHADGLITDFQARQLLRGKWNGFLLGNYRILDKIGAGGMGTVYLAEHRKLRRKAAIKVLPVNAKTPPETLARFYREARAVAAVSHPNVVQAHDIDEHDSVHFLAMEYVEGVSLQGLVAARGPLPPAQAAEYIRQAASGLDEIHRNGLVHRDLKPANIMVNRQGVVKVLDLGLAMFSLDGDDGLTGKQDGKGVMGTADYLAPEQAVDPHVVDIRADIYSLGATLYFLMAGRAPFHEGTLTQKLLWHQVREPAPLRAIRPDVMPGLEAIVARMMAKDPALRFQTPGEVAAALDPWSRPGLAAPDSGLLRPHAETLLEGVAGPDTSPSMLPFETVRGPLTPMPGYPAPSSTVELPAVAPPRESVAAEGRSPLLIGSAVFGGLSLLVAGVVLAWLVATGAFTTSKPTDPVANERPPVPDPPPAKVEEPPAPRPNFAAGFGGDALKLNGSATFVGNVLRLTPKENGKAGSAFTKVRLDARKFRTEFTFRVTQAGADGLAFVVTGTDANALGGNANNLGYVGINSSVAVGFNFYQNQEIRIGQNGGFLAGKLVKSLEPETSKVDIRSGRTMRCRITYDLAEKGKLVVRLEDAESKAAVEHTVYAIYTTKVVGGSTAHFGFTGATGGDSAIIDVLTWKFDE